MDIKLVKVTHPVFKIEMEVVPTRELKAKLAPRVLPTHWKMLLEGEDGIMWAYQPPFARWLKVIMGACRELDGRVWLHVSVSKWEDQTVQILPSWSDLKTVKSIFIGDDKKVIIVMPPSSQHVNLGEVHHLWHCLDGDSLPDFSRGVGSI